ncbi:hypothetical protein ACFP9V_03290 [Deinococcus radiopugnans]|uniref:Uncharacterized protein n=1 Tax=Deinococcus radiopugnans ATCC 19172 TaxID=585398 RepID=A0A5C4Y7Z4_9DEIO|nr:hypothetical protein [Deinococcus radiopugnans]MBB6017034.1 hypothetical protein [Deinococcus radiopugnans ATCC 19172]TNM71575.1 hypothetical protein FHR04_08535 [Deinococcus radiopugnans ATCC 19172]
MVHCVMGILGLLLGAGISAGVLTVVTGLPLAWARGVAALAFVALLAVLGSVLFAGGSSLERSFGAVYLVMGLLAGALLALPRLLRGAGHEPLWVSLGLGVAAVLLLIAAGVGVDALLGAVLPAPDPQTGESVKAQISQGLSNGLLIASPVVLILLSWRAWRGRTP